MDLVGPIESFVTTMRSVAPGEPPLKEALEAKIDGGETQVFRFNERESIPVESALGEYWLAWSHRSDRNEARAAGHGFA